MYRICWFAMICQWSSEVRASCCARTSTPCSRFPSIGLGHRPGFDPFEDLKTVKFVQLSHEPFISRLWTQAHLGCAIVWYSRRGWAEAVTRFRIGLASHHRNCLSCPGNFERSGLILWKAMWSFLAHLMWFPREMVFYSFFYVYSP